MYNGLLIDTQHNSNNSILGPTWAFFAMEFPYVVFFLCVLCCVLLLVCFCYAFFILFAFPFVTGIGFGLVFLLIAAKLTFFLLKNIIFDMVHFHIMLKYRRRVGMRWKIYVYDNTHIRREAIINGLHTFVLFSVFLHEFITTEPIQCSTEQQNSLLIIIYGGCVGQPLRYWRRLEWLLSHFRKDDKKNIRNQLRGGNQQHICKISL